MSQEKVLRPRSWPECNVFPAFPVIFVTDIGVQMNNTWLDQRGSSKQALKYDNEEENDHWVMNELKVLSQHLLDYNRRTFEKFMLDIENEYRERNNANKKLQRRTCEEYKAELEEENYHLRSVLQTEIDLNRQNESRINQLERDYPQCEQEIQVLNREIERPENALKEEIVELKSEISSLKSRLYQAKKDVDRLQCQIRVITSRKNTPERENSSDLYNPNINLEIANITELANAIDGYVKNRTTTRNILIDQIKRATRQVRRKENILYQDLICKQRRRYDVKAEQDLAITRSDLAEAAMGRVVGMVGYRPPIFYGRPGENPKNFLKDFQRYVVANQINVTPGAGQAARRAETLGVANLTAVRTLAAGNGGGQVGGLNTAGQFQGKVTAEIGRIGAGTATGADIISDGMWDENWSIAGSEPTNNASVASNAGGGFPAVTIAPNITLVFGQLMQGDMGIEEFFARIKKIGKLAEMTPEQQKEQLIRGLSLMNQYNLRMIAKFHDTHDNIVDVLAEAEKFTLSQKILFQFFRRPTLI
ncbi:hypothetical protein RclHR1_07680004 [Rhizophagus clarus]|uniref:Uncharacterized protein n=1 Tax=Rhizophagus clarus TaxID=94130 RepID=A0A2Z6SCV4_9GLOM|nr:hypothetical protein RclHR1_07680004 [Rhizophagus clarus]